ncbi:hypothetical protein F5884DRAFT_509941 [Xylogone sp. PMI_703]|nr:hypothetical protein F5884DRAFT_509941 [Xylogone sp. PMI_703]
MVSRSCLTYALLLSLCAARVIAYPVGISLGKSYLTSAYYTNADKLIPVAFVRANQEWQAFEKAWSDPNNRDSFTDSELRALFTNTLFQAKEATSVILKRSFTINSVVVPQHMCWTHTITLLREIAIELGFVNGIQGVTCAMDGARLAYDLDSCAGLRLDDEECDMRGTNFIMVLNYDENCLSVTMLDTGELYFNPYRTTHYPQYGEASGSILNSTKLKELSEDLSIFLEKLAEDVRYEWNITEPLQYLRAIVLSGEASNSAMEEMRSALPSVLLEYQDKLRISLDPNFVLAFGAAQRARHFIHDPRYMEPDMPHDIPLPRGHLEL